MACVAEAPDDRRTADDSGESLRADPESPLRDVQVQIPIYRIHVQYSHILSYWAN